MNAVRLWILNWRLWDFVREAICIDADIRRMAARDEYLLGQQEHHRKWIEALDAVVFRLDQAANSTGEPQVIVDGRAVAAEIREQIARMKSTFPLNAAELPHGQAPEHPE